MPNSYIKSLAKETGKSTSEIERLWNKAKQVTIDTFGTQEVAFGDKEYSYTVGVIKQMVGKKENLLSKFLESGKSASDFIEEAVDPNKTGWYAADTIARKFGLQQQAIYDWAEKNDINLVLSGHILMKQDIRKFVGSVVNGNMDHITDKNKLKFGFKK